MNEIKDKSKKAIKALFNPKNKLSLIPNWLSASRIIGGIIIPIMAYSGANILLIVPTTTFIALSDYLDGKIARYLKIQSDEGSILDAVSDKIFSLLLIISIIPTSPIFLINGTLEGTISFINTKSLKKGNKPKSNMLGKIKIWPLSAALVLGYISISLNGKNIIGISADKIMEISTLLSISIIPLQLINIKQYYKESKKESNVKPIINNHKNQEIKKEKKKTLSPKIKLKLNKNSNHVLMIHEVDKKIKNKSKTLSKIKRRV